MKVETYPWPHAVVNNYYPKELFNNMEAELTQFAELQMKQMQDGTLDKFTGYRFNICNINDRQGWKCCNTHKFKLFPKTTKCLASRSINIADLSYFPNHRKYDTVDIRTVITMVFSEDAASNVIHYDGVDKIFTSVTYVSPIISKGTILYDMDKKYVKEVEWAPNRALFFAPETDKTWHSYKTLPGCFRIAITEFIRNTDSIEPF
jgi:hypothetical protein